MDAHPTSFPGKRRIGSKYAAETGDGAAVVKKPPWQNVTAAAQIRPKRSFGVPRSSNALHAPMEKPLLVSKPRKIPPVVKSPPDPDPVLATKAEARVSNKKKQQVSFQEPKAAVANTSEENEPEEVVRTPMLTIKPAVSGTPYLTAQNCSKCKLDELESSEYWLAQIRLAECTGKHFVSAAFFRLALECHAQPFHKLRSELKHYVSRHPVISTESMWTDLSQAYGLEKEKLVYHSCDLVLNNSLLAETDDSLVEPEAELCCSDQIHVSLIKKDDSETIFDTDLFGCEAHKDECSKHVNIHHVEDGENVVAEVKYNRCDDNELEKMEQSESSSIDASTNCCFAKDNHCDEKELEKVEQSESPSINTLTNCCSVKDNHCDGKESEKMEQSESRSTDTLTNCCSAKDNHCDEKELEMTKQAERQSIDTITGSNCCTVASIPCTANKPLEGTVSELKSCGDSFINKSELRSNNSFQQKKVPTSSTKGRGMFSSKVSAKNAVRISDGKCRKNRNDQITGKNKGDGNVKAVSKVEHEQMGEN